MTVIEVASDTVLERRDVVWRDVAGEMVVLDLDGKVVMGLNDTGGGVWERLNGVSALGDIAKQIAELHEVELERVLGDVLAFARVLVERGLARAVTG